MDDFSASTVGSKADFDSIYNQPDARSYYRVLGSHGYEIPQHGAKVFAQLAHERTVIDVIDTPTVLDLCCSYGVGAALLKSDLNLDELYVHYAEVERRGLEGEALIRADIELLEQHLLPNPPRVIGIDVAEKAVDYALRTGLLDDGTSENLEEVDPSPSLVALLSEVDLITTTGGVGYVTEATFARLLAHTQQPPWVASFCLEVYDYEPIANTLASHGLITEHAERKFHQRHFANIEERDWALGELTSRGRDVTASASEDCYFADFFLSRPAGEVAARPLAVLLPGLT